MQNRFKTAILLVAIAGVLAYVPSVSAAVTCTGDIEEVGGICVPKASATGQVDKTAYEVIESVIKWMLGIAGVLAIAVIVSSGAMYVTSAGDKDRTNRAQQTLTYAIIGLIVVLIAYSIVITVAETLLN